jgi:diguanylate cyclase (GGDEF)-like protein
MNENFLNFLSEFPCFDNERNLFIQIENYLVSEHLIRPMLAYSINNSSDGLHISKSRSIIGKSDRLKLYSAKLLDAILAERNDIKFIPCLEVKVENCFYYYLNLGIKNNQFFFGIFSSTTAIDINLLKIISNYSSSHLGVLKVLEDLRKVQDLIHIDDVTGLYNQRKLYKDLSFLVDKFKKEKDPFCVLFIDLDHFKRVNDNFGHLIGTRLLELVAIDVKQLLRDTDLMYRYGGDEFVVILVGANAAAGKMVGERILHKIKSKKYEFESKDNKSEMNLSVSIGVAEFPSDAKSSEEVLTLADRMMYEAKESGRGIVFNTQDIFKSALKKVVDKE